MVQCNLSITELTKLIIPLFSDIIIFIVNENVRNIIF